MQQKALQQRLQHAKAPLQQQHTNSSTPTAAHQPAAHTVAAPVSAEATVSALLHYACDAAMRRWIKAAHTSNGYIFPPVPGPAVTPRPPPLSATVVMHAIVTLLLHTQPKLGSYYGFIIAILGAHAAAPSTEHLLLQPAPPPPPPQAQGGGGSSGGGGEAREMDCCAQGTNKQ